MGRGSAGQGVGGCISAAVVRVGRASDRAARAIALGGSVYERPCADGACTRCRPRPLRRARPVPPTGCAARPIGCSTSPGQPRPTQADPGQPGLGRRHYVPAAGQRRPGLSVRLSRPGQQASGGLARGGLASGGLARGGHHARRIGDPCLTTGLLVPAVHAGPARALGSGRVGSGSIGATPTVNGCTGTKPRARGVDAAAATIMPYRVRPRPKASGRASQRRSSKSASGPFLLIWLTRNAAWPTILTTPITGACTPASAIRPLPRASTAPPVLCPKLFSVTGPPQSYRFLAFDD